MIPSHRTLPGNQTAGCADLSCMSPEGAIRWTLTGAFAICAGLYLAQIHAARAWPARVGWLLHVVMAAAMIAMTWPVGMSLAPVALVLLFTACALYFAFFGLFNARVGHGLYHAAMMGSMVLMAVVMSPSATPGVPGADAMGAMPGMSRAVDVPTQAAATPPWIVVSCSLAAAAFLGAALWSFYLLIRGPHRPYANLLMTAGMGVSFAALVT
jgi:Domain of unknown function (DUF5134)